MRFTDSLAEAQAPRSDNLLLLYADPAYVVSPNFDPTPFYQRFRQFTAQFPEFPRDVKSLAETLWMWLCVAPDTEEDRAFLSVLESVLIYLFDDCFEEIIQQPQLEALGELFVSTTRDLTAGRIREWDSTRFIAAGASRLLAHNMNVRLAIIQSIVDIQKQLMSPKLYAHCSHMHYEMFDRFHKEAAHWKHLRENDLFATDQEYYDVKNFVCGLTMCVLPLVQDDEIQYWNYEHGLLTLSSVHTALRNLIWSWSKELEDRDPFNPIRREMAAGTSGLEATRHVIRQTNQQLSNMQAAMDKMDEHERASVAKSVMYGHGFYTYYTEHPRYGWEVVDEVIE
ncbi:hypothetical protein EMPS_10920 [Entomortierella parvispora]|uniref:Terpene synthase n=1 Tax=Entomortierella parvispora TaxID=205924 RepID=A0A9P3HL18_9FUNG|nr:hypothetical protein EMPS_10920 [Entomortierella parvispora]